MNNKEKIDWFCGGLLSGGILLVLFAFVLGFMDSESYSPQFKKGDAVVYLYDHDASIGVVIEEAKENGICKVLLYGAANDYLFTWDEDNLISLYSLGYFHGNANVKGKYNLPQYQDGWLAGRKDARSTTYEY